MVSAMWTCAKFSSTRWYDTLSVLVARGRAQVRVAASGGELTRNNDWSKRIRDMQYKIMKMTRWARRAVVTTSSVWRSHPSQALTPSQNQHD
eukprot:COSAG02_NODE_3313_length_6953_cov_95.249635_7_plen_92_part_00